MLRAIVKENIFNFKGIKQKSLKTQPKIHNQNEYCSKFSLLTRSFEQMRSGGALSRWNGKSTGSMSTCNSTM